MKKVFDKIAVTNPLLSSISIIPSITIETRDIDTIFTVHLSVNNICADKLNK